MIIIIIEVEVREPLREITEFVLSRRYFSCVLLQLLDEFSNLGSLDSIIGNFIKLFDVLLDKSFVVVSQFAGGVVVEYIIPDLRNEGLVILRLKVVSQLFEEVNEAMFRVSELIQSVHKLEVPMEGVFEVVMYLFRKLRLTILDVLIDGVKLVEKRLWKRLHEHGKHVPVVYTEVLIVHDVHDLGEVGQEQPRREGSLLALLLEHGAHHLREVLDDLNESDYDGLWSVYTDAHLQGTD